MAGVVACRCAERWLGALGRVEYVDCEPPDCLTHALHVANSLISGEYGGDDIMEESLRRITRALDVFAPHMTRLERFIAARMIHAAGDLTLLPYIRFVRSEDLLTLKRRCKVVVDVRAVASSIYVPCEIIVALEYSKEPRRRAESGLRELARAGALKDAVVAIGNSPTAINAVLEHRPAAVVATPPGFLNTPALKLRLLNSGTPSVVLLGTRGGSPIAAAVINAVVQWSS